MGNAIPGNYSGKPLNNQITGAYGSALEGANSAQNAAADPNQTQLGTANLQPYMNPYTKDVTNATMGELNRQEAMQNQNIQSQDTLNGSAWGDRSDVRTQANNRDFDVTRAQALAGLNSGNFNQAQQGAQYDINNRINAGQFGQQQLGSLANLGFGWGNQLNQNQLASGALQTAQQQQIMDAIKGQFGGFTGQGQDALNTFLGTLSGLGSARKETGEKQGWLGSAISGIGLIPGI